MNDDIIKRRKQVFNTILANNNILESEIADPETKETSDFPENTESIMAVKKTRVIY